MPDDTRKLKVHPALQAGRKKAGQSPETVEIEGFVGPATDEKIVEIWEDLKGTSRLSVPTDDIISSQQDEEGFTTLRVRRSARLGYKSVYTEELDAEFLDGDLLSEFMGFAALGEKEGKKPKFCKTLPIWKCVVSGIIVVTSTICTETWPCEASDDKAVLQRLRNARQNADQKDKSTR
jgi:hypothetical protein